MKLGKTQKLKVVSKVDFGIYLDADNEKVLLPKNEVPKDINVGDTIEVFLMRDSEDRPIATRKKPMVEEGNLAKLKVKEVTQYGAFLDWGMGKDLFLPYKEQTYKVEENDNVLVGVYLDKSERLCATMKVYKYLLSNSTYETEDIVTGTVYNINPQYGAFIAVDDKYHGLIQSKELTKPLKIGEEVNARVKSVRPDGKMDLSIRKKSYMQIDDDAKIIEEFMKENGNELSYTDKASPERIKQDFAMSKSEFKRAIGRLLKEGKISIEATKIQLVKIDKK